MRSLLVIGEALIDTVRLAESSTRSDPGGSPANVAIALGRLGRAPQLLTWIADDPAGRLAFSYPRTPTLTYGRSSVTAPPLSTATSLPRRGRLAPWSLPTDERAP
jgi:fructokinase